MIGGNSSPPHASVTNCNIGVIYSYQPETGYQRLPGSEELMPGKGYWLPFNNIGNQCELTVEKR